MIVIVPVFVTAILFVIVPVILKITARYQNYPTALSAGTGTLEHRIV